MLTYLRRLLRIFHWTMLPPLTEDKIAADPIDEFDKWFKKAKKYEYFDASAMTLSSVGADQVYGLGSDLHTLGSDLHSGAKTGQNSGSDLSGKGTAMGSDLWPQSRMVLLKGYSKEGFIFYC